MVGADVNRHEGTNEANVGSHIADACVIANSAGIDVCQCLNGTPLPQPSGPYASRHQLVTISCNAKNLRHVPVLYCVCAGV
jgi:hypothetical protein